MPGKPSTVVQIAVFAIFASIAVLVKFSMLYIEDYKVATSAKEGTCTTFNSSYGMTVTCNCGSGKNRCSSTYPCLAIYIILDQSGPPSSHEIPDEVTGGPKNDDTTVPDSQDKVVTQLFQNENALGYNFYACTVRPSCSRNKNSTAQEVARFDREYGRTGTTFKCYFLPHAPEKVILHVTPWTVLIHWFIWPAVIIILAFGVIGIVKYKRPDEDMLTLLGLRQFFNSCCKGKEEHPNEGTQEELEKCTPQAPVNYPLQQNVDNQASQYGNQYGDPQTQYGNQYGNPQYPAYTYGPSPNAAPPAYDNIRK